MRFSKLRLTGFKSFVDPTELLISDGLTGVVGPNGCGKSNLLEALRWVMGENRPTAMRGGGMEDVIFAGAATRPARNFAEVGLLLDNSDRLAPSGFNDSDTLEIVRRITRDVGSAYKASGKDVRARDIQVLFADASTGSHSPSLVRQGQISELINAKPKNRRRVLEEAAGISGLYQRRHEAELKLSSTEANLTRVDDVLEQLAQQLAQLAKQARQAARYRAIGEDLRNAECVLLFLRWRDAEQDCLRATAELRDRTITASRSESAAREAAKARLCAEEMLPPMREEEGLAGVIMQRLLVEQDTLFKEEERILELIETLNSKAEQLALDIERERGLNRDAGQTIQHLELEMRGLDDAQNGFDIKLASAESDARDAASILQASESDLAQKTEDVARLAARHQSAHRLLSDCETTLARNKKGVENARESLMEAKNVLKGAQQRLKAAQILEAEAFTSSELSETRLQDAEGVRTRTQSLESETRARRSEADGEASALRAEVAALEKLVDRETFDKEQIVDQMRVVAGFEKAVGAALSDDLKASKVKVTDVATGWVILPPYDNTEKLPDGAEPLSKFVSGTEVLTRRISQIGLVDTTVGAKLQPLLAPGQRLVSKAGDLWRWDGYKTLGNDVSSTSALRFEQVNRLTELRDALAGADKVAEAAGQAHEAASKEFFEATEADKLAREARRHTDKAVTEASRTLSRAEADCNLAQSRLESLELMVKRQEEDALVTRAQFESAEKAVAGLGDLNTARCEAEDVKTTVEASRIKMMTKRSLCDELRLEGESRFRRINDVERELKTWRERLETAEQRSQDILGRQEDTKQKLREALEKPKQISENRKKNAASIFEAEKRCKEAADALALGEEALRERTQSEREFERIASEAREVRAASQARADATQDLEERPLSGLRKS